MLRKLAKDDFKTLVVSIIVIFTERCGNFKVRKATDLNIFSKYVEAINFGRGLTHLAKIRRYLRGATKNEVLL